MDLDFDLLAIIQHLEDTPEGAEQFLCEFLFFPEFQTFGNRSNRITRILQSLAKEVLEKLTGDTIARRAMPKDVGVEPLKLTIDPPSRSTAWEEPVELELQILLWNNGESTRIAYAPSLGIEVVASDPSKLPEMITEHVSFDLRRRGFSASFFGLASLARISKTEIRPLKWQVGIETPKERIRINEPEKKKILPKVATGIQSAAKPSAYCREDEVARLAGLLAGRHPTCVLLVGESGVGKTAITNELAQRRNSLGLAGRPFWKTSGSRIVAGQTGYGMWQKRCTQIIKEAKESKAILCLGNLHELMQVGQSVVDSSSIASFLRPSMVRGELLAILECTPGQLAAIEAKNPKLLDPYRRLKIDEPGTDTSLEILTKINDEPSKHPGLSREALRKLEALHRRYMTYSAFPGRPARFLEGLRSEAGSGKKVSKKEVTAAFSRETGLPLLMLEETVPFNDAAVRKWFLERVHAQDQAVNLVVDRLSIVKAQLSRPSQPLASFLFTGPTGVGKTELAKALAEFLYGSRDRLLRLDMSEFCDPHSASRLVSSSFDQSEGLLTSKVRDQPFSVILLDEFEKAHPDIFDLLLQVLGEARLTDAAGRLADFSNSVIIMTSNLGAESFGKPKMGFGSGDQQFKDAQEHFLSVAKEKFRPEFFNRIDRIIPFLALDKDAIRSIAKREIEIACGRDGFAGNQLELKLAASAIQRVIEKGHDPRYGARPLKRAIEREILLPVADFLNGKPRQGGTITVEFPERGDQAKIQYQKGKQTDGEVVTESQRTQLSLEIDEAADIRRKYQLLKNSSMFAELESERRRLVKKKEAVWRKAWKKHKKGDPDPQVPYQPELEARLETLNRVIKTVEDESDAASAFEEHLLVRFYSGNTTTLPSETSADEGRDLRQVGIGQFEETLINLMSETSSASQQITLTFRSESGTWLFQLADAYLSALSGRRIGYEIGEFRRKNHDPEFRDDEAGTLSPIPSDRELLHSKSDSEDVVALAIRVSGAHCGLLLGGESGLHRRVDVNQNVHDCIVAVANEPLEELAIAAADLERISTRNHPVRRQFSEDRGQWKDTYLQESAHPGGKGTGLFDQAVLKKILDESLMHKALRALGA